MCVHAGRAPGRGRRRAARTELQKGLLPGAQEGASCHGPGYATACFVFSTGVTTAEDTVAPALSVFVPACVPLTPQPAPARKIMAIGSVGREKRSVCATGRSFFIFPWCSAFRSPSLLFVPTGFKNAFVLFFVTSRLARETRRRCVHHVVSALLYPRARDGCIFAAALTAWVA